MGVRNYLVEGVSGTGKTSVCRELSRRGYQAINGDRELAYQGDPETGEATETAIHQHHIWDVDRVRALAADGQQQATFFCGGSRNFRKFIDLFDETFVLDIDLDTLRRRLDHRPPDEWGSRPSERDLVVRLHRTKEDIPHTGVVIDATQPLEAVVDEILQHAGLRDDDVPDLQLVTRLLHEQAPQLASMPVRASPTSGSSNWVFRVGDTMSIRLPRSDDYVADLANEVRWLPRLAPQLPVPVPDIVAVGQPSEAFPRPWAVVSWVPGELPLALDGSRQALLAESMGAFLQSLHAVDTIGVPAGAEHWGYRCGEPVTETIDRWADHAAAELADLFDPTSVREAWRRLRDVPAATGAACWVHTDLSEENLLAHHDGRLAGVIDFGGVGIGDRSVDLLYAWSIFDAPARDVLRVASGADGATWTRARAWAFVGPGLLTIANYRHTMPTRAERLISMVETIAAEVDIQLR